MSQWVVTYVVNSVKDKLAPVWSRYKSHQGASPTQLLVYGVENYNFVFCEVGTQYRVHIDVTQTPFVIHTDVAYYKRMMYSGAGIII